MDYLPASIPDSDRWRNGIAALIFYATGIPIYLSYFLINAALLLAALKILGLKFMVNGKKVVSGIYMVATTTQDGEKGTVCKITIIN